MRSIQAKLLWTLIPIIVLALVGVAYLNHNKAKEFLEENFRGKSFVDINLLTEQLDHWFTIHEERVRHMAMATEIASMDPDQQLRYLQQKVHEYPEYNQFFVADRNGAALTDDGIRATIQDRVYFQQIMNGSPYVVSDPLRDKLTNAAVVVVAAPIKNVQGELVGLFGVNVPIEALHQLVGDVKVGKTGYAFLTEAGGKMISYPPNPEWNQNKPLSELGVPELEQAHTAAQSGKTDVVRYTFKNVDKFNFYAKMKSTGWSVFLTAPVAEASEQLSYLAKLSAVTAGVVLVFTILVVIAFASRLVRPIKQLSALTSQVAEGDLTIKIDSKSFDEVGMLGQNFNAMIGRMQEILIEIGHTSDHVRHSSDTMVRVSEETKLSAEQVATTINELAIGTNDIATSVNDTTEKVQQMVGIVQNMDRHTYDVIEASAQSKTSADKGRTAASQAVLKMSEINHSVQQVAEIIRKLDHQSKEIGTIVGIITNIADQTNLLALNASIEAARAGEHGRGFVVVAEEVRKLAYQTGLSAERITKLIEETQYESHRAVQAVTTGTVIVEEGALMVEHAGDAFVEIDEHVERVLRKNREIHEWNQTLVRIGHEIGNEMGNISAVTEEASAGSEEVSAASQQQAASANQIAEDAVVLAGLAGKLREMLARFKTSES